MNSEDNKTKPFLVELTETTCSTAVVEAQAEAADAQGVKDQKRVPLRLEGLDGNAFSLLGAFARAARQHGWTETEITEVFDLAKSGDYDHLLQVLIAHTKDPGE